MVVKSDGFSHTLSSGSAKKKRFTLKSENQMGELFKVPYRTFMSVSSFSLRFYLQHAVFFYLTVTYSSGFMLGSERLIASRNMLFNTVVNL